MSLLATLKSWICLPTGFTRNSVQCLSPTGLHRMAYTEWGNPTNPKVLVCVHGLTRNGRDFDFLAAALSKDYRVVCPDVVGRGCSDWLADPAGYGFPQYMADMVTLIARLKVNQVDWLGTSMGGLIGMFLANQEDTPIRRLIINDVGPVVTGDAIRRIAEYVGKMPQWPTLEEAEAVMRVNFAPFGQLTDGQWRHLTEHSVRQTEQGMWELRYDPGIAEPFRNAFAAQDVNLWPVFDKIACPTLAIRGAESDLLSRDTWLAMAERGPHAELAEVPGVGHAPPFMDVAQVGIVRDYLERI